ncbi:DUF1707 domain-containing protein [Amycolatopsis sp.]|uniref:DUF1707 SHOCT-like domain-containing protein n=1 Tax=Amycolatopsis sp. TaxID=37632 RepID=UPI002B9D807C|nr:DUF1707 domain-containing protein [Amycolatopsis sp.]HVV11309.1 DUF1707 domain-containing protein [Amycolatopsis sp.]
MATGTSPHQAPTDAVRCSDTEREQTATRLQDAAAEGRFSLEEVEERLARTYAARYRGELDALTADLPPAAVRTGWAAVLGLAREQVRADLAGLLGRGEAGLSPRRRAAVLVAVLIVVVLVVSMVMLALHGVTDGEPHRFDHG